MHKLGLLLLPEFSNFGLCAVTEPLFVANWLAQRKLFEWRPVSVDGKPVRASNGAAVAVDGDLGSAEGCESVFVLASFEPARTAGNRAVVQWLRRAARSGVELGGIENGSLALAEAGLLDDHPAALHWDNSAGFQELFPKIRISPRRISFSRNRLTCAGASAILELMIAWIERNADADIAREVSRHLLLGAQDGSEDAARAGEGPGARAEALIRRAQLIMRSHIDDPLPCDALAQRLDISLRQLERLFKQSLGRTVQGEYRLARIEKAHQYLQQTALPVTEVAALTGFSSIEYFSKVYRRAFGVLPSTDRRQSTDAPVFRRG